MRPENNPFAIALTHALKTRNANALQPLVKHTVHEYAKARFFGAAEPVNYAALEAVAWEAFFCCRVRSSSMLLAAGLPIETKLHSPCDRGKQYTLLEAAVHGCEISRAAQAKLVELLLAAGAVYNRTPQSDWRHPKPIMAFVRKPAVARAFMKRGVPVRAFTGMNRNLRHQLERGLSVIPIGGLGEGGC